TDIEVSPCQVEPSPLMQLCEWWQGGRRGPLPHLLDSYQVGRVTGLSVTTVLLGTALWFSIRAHRPFGLRIHLRTLMVTVALLPLGYMAGSQVWTMWDRWDFCERSYHRDGQQEEWSRRASPEDTEEIVALKQEAASIYRMRREEHRRALRTLSFWLTL